MIRLDFLTQKLFLILLCAMVAGCNSKPQEYAPDRNYYFTVKSNSSSETSAVVKKYLETNIPAFKYTITNASGIQWPYYKAYELDEKVHRDSLAIPHTIIHRMIPLENNKPSEGEFLVQIEIFEEPDTIPNYSVTIFRQTNNQRQLSASTGIHYIHPSEYRTSDQLADLLLKNIVRYSFK